ncbi:MAG: TIGR00725 family protein [Oscillatoriales cyanobacterium C42_A2020_001]|nr:TIGR00725 family protein [Leptolyngbyaceae cyanobacterium C42_A2020_001]
MRQPIIGVMGPGEQAAPLAVQTAYELGQQIAESGWVLLTGGRNTGVMDAVNRGAKSAGGLTVGILPTSDRAQLSAAVDIPIVTGMGNARNAINVLSSDVVIACGMGVGTASEVAIAIKAEKPVVLLNWSQTGVQFFQEFASEGVSVADNVNDAIAIVHQLLQSV